MYTGGKSTQITSTPFNETEAKFSPDAKWIAYRSNETGRGEVWVQSFRRRERDSKCPPRAHRGRVGGATARSCFIWRAMDN